jgi:hypothetical protein
MSLESNVDCIGRPDPRQTSDIRDVPSPFAMMSSSQRTSDVLIRGDYFLLRNLFVGHIPEAKRESPNNAFLCVAQFLQSNPNFALRHSQFRGQRLGRCRPFIMKAYENSYRINFQWHNGGIVSMICESDKDPFS